VCGICGAYGLKGRPALEESEFDLMLASLKQRGPDATYRFSSDRVMLGNTRLAIIDVEGGHQPAKSEDGTIPVVFNGEIYNHALISREILKKKHVFNSRSDTEVLPHLYEELSERMFRELNGMFAIALYDSSNDRFILARDRLGEKPLYYGFANDTLYFASEPKALLVLPCFARIDPAAFCAYLRLEYVPAPFSIFKGIKKLPPGHFLSFERGRRTIGRFFEIPYTCEIKDERHAVSSLESLIEDSVRMRLISDVPLGVFLSGGIDSSLVAAMAAKHARGRVKTFTIGFEEPDFDESAHALRVARHLSTDHDMEIFSIDALAEKFEEAFAYLDEPLGDASYLPTWFLSRFAKKKVTVALGGDGGDELFFGYPTYIAHNLIRYYDRLPSGLARILSALVESFMPVSTSNISFDFKLRRFISGHRTRMTARHARWLGSFDDASGAVPLPALLSDDFQAIVAECPAEKFFSPILSSCGASGTFERIAYLDMFTYLSDDILVKVDRASMANSLECRAPFLDHRIVLQLARIIEKIKFDGVNLKKLLRKIALRHLPKEIVDRPKKGFGIPVGRWLKENVSRRAPLGRCGQSDRSGQCSHGGQLLPIARELLSAERISQAGIFRSDAVSKLLEDHISGKADNRKQLFTLIAFEIWRSRHGKAGF
jgi:asparagine synthase (glutamine-hydrolysing)